MKTRFILLIAVLLPLSVVIWISPFARRERGAEAHRPPAGETLDRLKEAWAKDRQLLTAYEREQSKLRTVVIERRKSYQEGMIEKTKVEESERAFVAMLRQIQEARQRLMETDLALTEATLGDELERLPPLAVNEFSETERLARFNGGSRWSLQETPGVEKFYSQTFGHRLPISAYGQSATHDRMGLDHRNAVDVALHPDSPGGKALIRHLRGSGIPFIAFKHAAPGAATGPHIHIGKPSVRIAAR